MHKPSPSLTLLVLAGVLAGALVPLPAAAGPAVVDNGSTITIYSPTDPLLGRREYQCVIPKRFAETTDRAIRSGLLQIACGTVPGAIRAGAVIEMWSAGSATATDGTSGAWDYNFYHSKIWIRPSDTSRHHLSFRINDDQTVEGNEYFQFALKWSTKLGWKPFWVTLNESVHVVTVWIDDDDAYSLSVSPASVAEAGGAKTVTVTAAVAGGTLLGEARTLDVQVGAGTDHAVEGTDYQTVNNFDLTIPKGSSSATGTFTLTPVDDTHLEGGERITVAATAKTAINGQTLRPRVTGTGLWLTDSDSGSITLSATPDVDEGGGAQTVTVTATSTVAAQRAIPVTISVGASGDAAVSGTDYDAVSDVTLTIPSGSKSGTGTFTLTPINDTTQENDETLSIAGTVSRGGAVTGTSVKILDNDVLLALNPASVGEEGGAQTITVTARAKTARTASRALTVSVGKLGDQAVSGTDYGAVTDFSLTIAANQASGTATFTFTPRDDTIIEGNETLTVHATGTGVDVNSATLTMTETDTTDFVITLNPSSVAEDSDHYANYRNLTITVSMTDGYTASDTITCNIMNGGGSATWSNDYSMRYGGYDVSPPGQTGIAPSVEIDPGNTSGIKTVTFKVENDSHAEGDETVRIVGLESIGLPTGEKSCTTSDRTVNSEPYPADLTITDDDGSISLSVTPNAVWEDTPANVEVRATLPGTLAAREDTLVTVSFGKNGDAAVEGTDYATVDDFYINIPKGNRYANHTFWFSPIDDTLAEGTETLSIDGTATKFPVSGTSLNLEDDEALKLTLSASPSSVAEDAGATTVTITAATAGTTWASDKRVGVNVGMSTDSATEGTDYATVANFNLTIAANQTSGTGTFTLTPVHDATPESDESISVRGWLPGTTVSPTSITLRNAGVPITLAASPASVTEDGGAKSVTVTATMASATTDTAVTISVGKSGDTAVEGTDYAAVDDFTLTIKQGATTGTGTFTLTPVNDALYEGTSESLTIDGSAANARVTGTSVAITDDDASAKPKVSLSVKPTRVKECSAATTVTVTATLPDEVSSLPEARDVTISVGESGDSATSGTDYKAVKDFTLTIPAGHHNGLATFELEPIDDTTQEGDETITVSGTATRLGVGSDAEVTIEDDDQPIIVLTMNPATIPENDQPTSVKVTASLWDSAADRCPADTPGSGGAGGASGGAVKMSAASMAATAESMVGASADEVARAVLGPEARRASQSSDQTVTVTIGDTGDTAVAGTDYTAVSDFDIVIRSGQSTGSATFTTTASLDNILEPTETLTAKGTATGTTVTPAGGHLDDKDQMAPALLVTPKTVAESAAATSMTVTVTTGGVTVAQSLAVDFTVSGGTATAGTDFATVKDFELTLAAGTNSVTGTFTLTPTADRIVEGDETLTVRIPDTTLSAAVTLTDDDSTDITLTASPASVSEGATSATVTVTAATDGDTFPADRTVTVSVGASGDGATPITDYQAVRSFDVVLKTGTTSATGTFTLTPRQDTVVEGDETISVTGTSTGLTVNGTSVTISDDDSTDITLRASPSSVAEGDEATMVTVTAVTDGDTFPANRTVTVSVGGSDDTATSGTDYAAVADLDVTITVGRTTGSATFTLTPKQDTLVEGAEAISVTGTSTGLTVNGAGVTITDDDTAPEVDLTVSPASVSESDAATTVKVTAAFSNTSTYGEAKTVAVTVGDGGDSATSGTDYSFAYGRVNPGLDLIIAAGASTATGTFTLTPTGDRIVEGDETISVHGTATGLTVNGTDVTIIDDDSTEITLTASPVSVSESDSATTVTVTAATDGDTFPADTTITVTVGSSTDTATSGTDYAAVAGFDVTITQGSTTGTGTFTLTPTSDTLVEGNETISVAGASTGLTVNGTSVTIIDDDSAPAVNLTASLAGKTIISEGASSTTVTVTARFSNSSTYAADTTIAVTVGDGADSATSGTDYAAVADFDVIIAAGASSATGTFVLTPVDDTLVEGNETISVKGTYAGLTVNDAGVTITDDDGVPVINLTASPPSVAESASATTVTVTAAFSNASTYGAAKTVSVTVGDGADSAESRTDYAAVTGFDVTIAAGASSGTATFMLTPTGDTLIEGNETITVAGTNADLTVNGTSVRLTDDDGVPVINLTASPPSVAESASATTVTVTARFSNASTYGAAKTVAVTVGDGADSATSGTDYASVTGFDVTIAAGASSGTATFTLTPTGDTLVEGNETIGVAGASTGLTVNGASLTLTDDDTPPAIGLSVNPASVAETASTTTVTVTAAFSNSSTYGAAKTVSVTVGKSGDSAASGTDYAAVTGFDVTVAAGATSGTAKFSLAPTDDTLVEGDESITVAGTSDLTVNGTSLTLTDDDATVITLTASPATVTEGDSATAVTVTATTDGDTFPADRAVRVKIGKAGDGATSGTDYAAVTAFDVTVTAGQTSGTGTFTLTPTDDNVIEGDESITVSGTSTGLTVNGTSVTIEDNEKPTIILDIEPFLNTDPDKLPEDAGATRVTVTAGTEGGVFALDRQVYVTVGKEGDSATFGDGKDYDTPSPSFHVTITANRTSGATTFTLTPNDDVIVEGDESLTLVGSATVDWLDVTEATITIQDDDVPGMSLSASPASVAENAGAKTVSVKAATGGVTFKAARTVSVTVGRSGDGAKSGTDYAAVTGFDVTIAAGRTSGTATFTLTPNDDALIEGDESITVAGQTTGYTVSGTSVTLTDDDATEITLSASPASVAENAGAKTVSVKAATDGGTFSADRTVSVTVGKSGDTAVSDTDYAAVTGFDVTIAAGQTSGTGTFTLTPTQDTEIEGDETITVAGTSGVLTVTGASVTLTDDDATDLTLTAAPASVSEGATSATVTVRAATDGDTFKTARTVTVSVGDDADGATSGTDYTAVSDFTITIAAGKSSGTGTFTLTPVDDTLFEGDETITVAGASTGLTVSGASVTLTDDDQPTLTLTADPASVAENAGATQVTITASTGGVTFADGQTVTVTVGDGDKDKDGHAEPGEDYETVSDFTITIGAGKSSGTGTFTLTPVDDNLIEGDEEISVAGTSEELGAALIKMTLTDDDAALLSPPLSEDPLSSPPGDPSAPLTLAPIFLTADPSRVTEGGGMETVTVTATVANGKAYPDEKTVAVTVGGGSAVSGSDYAAVSSFTITIPAEKNSANNTFTLTPIDDRVIEGDETIAISGTEPTVTVSGTGVTIVDDDYTELTLTASPASVPEEGGATEITVTAETDGDAFADTRTVTVSVGAAGDGAVSGTDYATVSDFTVTISAGHTDGSATFTLTPIDDRVIEGDEALTVAGTSPGLVVHGTEVTIVDDDYTEITLTPDPARVPEEGGATEVTVTATTDGDTFAEDRTVTVSVGADADGAESGTDYEAVSGFTITIAAGRTSGSETFTLRPIDDTVIEGDEAVTVAGTSPGLVVHDTEVTIVDDDHTEITLTPDPARVPEEGGATEVTVTATTDGDTFAEDRTVTVSVGADADGAESGTDYEAVSGFTITIAAGRTSGSETFTLRPIDDTVIEGDEAVTVAGTSPGLVVHDTEVTIVDDDHTEITLTPDPARVPEEGGATEVTVTATTDGDTFAEDRTVTVSVGATDDEAVSGTDYEPVSGFTITIAAGRSSGSAAFTLTPIDDRVIEGDETITVAGASTGLVVNGTVVTVVDDDHTELTLTASPASVSEDAGSTEVTVTAETDGDTFADDRTVTVTVGADGDGAESGSDYATVSGFTITIAAGRSSGSAVLTLRPIDDTVIEGDEAVTVAGTSPGLVVHDTEVTIVDDDYTEITLTANPASVAEDADATEVTVTATTDGDTFADDRTVTVTVGADADGAESGTDYATVSGFTITITAGRSSGSAAFTLTPIDDTVIEGDEPITVSGTSKGLVVNGTRVTIVDDDHTEITLTADPASVSEDAGSTEVTVTASTDGDTFATERTVTVTVGADADGAESGSDYEPVSGFTITIAAGQSSGSAAFTLTPVDDTVIEGDQTVTVAGASTGLTVNGTRVTIVDDDHTEITLTPNPASVSEDAGATEVTVTATTDGDVFADDRTVTVTVGADGDGAESGTDYEAVSGFTITIAAGRSSGSAAFTLTPVDDSLIEGDEALTVSGTSPGLVVNGTSVTIVEDDVTDIEMTVEPEVWNEGDGPTPVTVTLRLTSETVRYAYDKTVAVSVHESGVEAAVDFDPVASFEITIPAGERSASEEFVLTPENDRLVEIIELITVIGQPDGAGGAEEAAEFRTAVAGMVEMAAAALREEIAVLTTASAGAAAEEVDAAELARESLAARAEAAGVLAELVELEDDDAARITLSVVPEEVDEDGGRQPVTVTATLEGAVFAVDRPVVVSVGAGGDSAEVGVDYKPVPVFEITIPKKTNEGTGTFTFVPIDDSDLEDDEEITVGGVLLGTGKAVHPAQMRLLDDDEAAARERFERVSETILPEFTRAWTESVLEMARQCGVGPRAGEDGGLREVVGALYGSAGALNAGETTLEETLASAGAGVAVPVAGGAEGAEDGVTEGARVTAWAEGDYRRVGGEGEVEWNGQMLGAHGGVDARLEHGYTAGVGLSWSEGTAQYSDGGGEQAVEGTYRSRLASVHPYLCWSAEDGSKVWGTVGLGTGGIEIDDEVAGRHESGAWAATAAAGGSVRLLSGTGLTADGAAALDLRSDAWLTRHEVSGDGYLIRGMEVITHRVRLALTGTQMFALGGGATVSPEAELGVRWDGGAGAGGLGVELGGAVGFAEPRWGLTAEVRGRALLVHEREVQEWGVSGRLRLGPQESGEGLSVSVEPEYGAAASGGERLWSEGVAAEAAASEPGASLSTEVGYGFAAAGGAGLLTPYGGLDLSGGERSYRVGGRMAVGGGFDLELEGRRRETGFADPSYEIALTGTVSW